MEQDDSLNTEIQRLKAEILRLREENRSLREENTRLRDLCGFQDTVSERSAEVCSDDAISPAKSRINKYSSSEEKIALFRALFSGRKDVFARRWYSRTTGKSGYQPVCENEWQEGICDKHRYKCKDCPNRRLQPLSDRDVYRHLEGKDEYCRDVIGIYPMLPDETCCFLCLDFDGDDCKEEALTFLSVCGNYRVPAYMERSRSGNGIHIWLFFDAPIQAALARKLGSGLLTKAMEQRGTMSFKAYDRMLPNQDTMPEGGFGNLIALPLQGRARKSGNSMFIDESFRPYEDQWAYLSSVEKTTKDKAEELTAAICSKGELGILTDNGDEPWNAKPKEKSLTPIDFSSKLEIVKANMIFVPTEPLSQAAQNRIKRLAAFKNPDFYRTQAMRMSTYNKPRIICLAELFEKYIALPRGCEEALLELLDNSGADYQIVDKTNPGNNIDVSFNGTLREEQQTAADALLAHNTGVLSAATAFGKTVVASYLIGQRKTNTLILVHTQALMNQWKSSLEQFLVINEPLPETPKGRGRKKELSHIGQLGAGKDTLHGYIDIAVMQSLINGDEIKELVRDYGMIIVDECHHISAVSFEMILRYANARYVYGLTATPTRQDGHHPIIFMQCGPIRYKVDPKSAALGHSFEHYLIPRFTAFRSVTDLIRMPEAYKALVEDDERNRMIANDITASLKQGRTPIILTERREHIDTLAGLLKGSCPNIITLTGADPVSEKRSAMERLSEIAPDEPMLIIATGKYVGEGFDYPRLDTLFLALPISWKGKVMQYIGRLHREYGGKTEVIVYDYVDVHVPMLENMYRKRMTAYKAAGYHTKTGTSPDITPDLIYDGKSFYPVYEVDIRNAKREILIVSPFMRKNRLMKIAGLLSEMILNNVAVTIVTRPPEDYRTDSEKETTRANIELLHEYGINISLKSKFHQKFAVMDQRIVWYGSVNFLSYGTADESIMRLESADIAGRLIDSVHLK